jgi:alcohol dehydrogenase class IV
MSALERATSLLDPDRCLVADNAALAIGPRVTALSGADARVLVITDERLLGDGGLDPTLDALRRQHPEVAIWSELSGEPGEEHVDAAAVRIREHAADCVIGIGGGSVLDVAKLAASVAAGDRPTADYALAAHPLPEAIAVILMPTTAGTGAEATTTAVFRLADGRKVWGWGEPLRPRLAVLDPVLTVGLPGPLTAATGLDALVHAIEAYTGQRASAASDSLALAAIELVAQYLPRAVAVPDDLAARRAMLIAAHLAGGAIDAAGTGVAHAIGHALGSLAHVHHGRAVALALRAALDWNIGYAPRRYTRVAEAMGVPREGRDEVAWARSAAAAFAALVRAVGIGTSLADHGLRRADAARLAQASAGIENEPMLRNNVRQPDAEALLEICDNLLAEAG